ncbi:hypothetical protein PL8927_830218 [Planktothrix serta PCC 8927]|uniref:Uncharacterized protein n=1 Tax=Planktothrix serta PCC 8927 TaxID=671068 RepID=A0A7Z9E5F5_9CYAN|nr:hypothetical protein PL8927_830218 [Planktothrix serta PCC 8927]
MRVSFLAMLMISYINLSPIFYDNSDWLLFVIIVKVGCVSSAHAPSIIYNNHQGFLF